MSEMTIARLAAAGGVGVETVRYYQRRGLLPTPPRPEGSALGGGVRRYGTEDVRRLRFIRSAQAASSSAANALSRLIIRSRWGTGSKSVE